RQRIERHAANRRRGRTARRQAPVRVVAGRQRRCQQHHHRPLQRQVQRRIHAPGVSQIRAVGRPGL
ncbi:MAG: GTP cyclohydrolase I type 1, partial [uncultured Cytophagales bacterium]